MKKTGRKRKNGLRSSGHHNLELGGRSGNTDRLKGKGNDKLLTCLENLTEKRATDRSAEKKSKKHGFGGDSTRVKKGAEGKGRRSPSGGGNKGQKNTEGPNL